MNISAGSFLVIHFFCYLLSTKIQINILNIPYYSGIITIFPIHIYIYKYTQDAKPYMYT